MKPLPLVFAVAPTLLFLAMPPQCPAGTQLAGTQGHAVSLWNARASKAEGLEQGTAALLDSSASHLLPPVPPILPAAKNVPLAVL